jgi:hypothetical protein
VAVIDRPIILPKLAFLTAWSMLDVGQMPTAFGTNLHHWTSADGQRELEARAMAALTDLGLARNHRLNDLWRSTIHVLAAAGREYYAFSNFADGRSCSVLVAARDEDAIRAVIDDHIVSLEPIENKWFATALLDTLPDVPAAAIRSAAVSKAAEEADAHDLEHLNEVMRRPRDAVHQIYVARRGTGGERRRSVPITAVDIRDSGRVIVYTGSDGDIVMKPASARQFVRTLNTTYDGL